MKQKSAAAGGGNDGKPDQPYIVCACAARHDFTQFDQVAEGIGSVNADETGNRRIFLHREAALFQGRQHRRQRVDNQAGMCVQGWLKVFVYPQMQLQRAALEPQTAARLQGGRLGQLRHAEDGPEKAARGLFAAGRHGKLDVVDGNHGHGVPLGWRLMTSGWRAMRGFYPFAASAAGDRQNACWINRCAFERIVAMNIRFLETFVWLAKLKNFRLTAERLHTTQAAVSSRIATLEQDFGVRLFDRGAREVTLTTDGSKALVYAERMVKLMREMKDDMSDKQVYAGVIRIGVIESIVHSWFPDFLGRVHKMFPRLQIEIASDITNLHLCEFPMRWVGSPKLNIGNETLSLSDLATFPIISFARNSGPHAVIERMFSGSERGALHINCIASVATMIRLVTDGFGVAAVPPAIIQRELNEEILHPLRVDVEFPALVMLACLRADNENPLTETIARIAQETAADFALNWGHEIARLPSQAP